MTLEHLSDQLLQLSEFPLLPCGPTKKVPNGKAPIDPETGFNLTHWEATTYTPDDLLTLNGNAKRVTAAGINHALAYREGLCSIDMDGASTIALAKTFGCTTKQLGWLIGRDTDPVRLKAPHFIPEELRHFFNDANGNPVGKVVLTTKPAEYKLDENGERLRDADGRLIKLSDSEQIELFWASGQTVVLGQHIPSNGHYTWQGSPINLKEPCPEWWAFITHVLEEGQKQSQPSRKTASGTTEQSGPGQPCQICGRDTSGACTTYIDGERVRINCFEGQTFNPPTGLKEGDTTVINGVTWAFTGHGFNPQIGSFSKFAEHVERPPAAEPLGAAQGEEPLDEDDLDLRREALERFRKAQQSDIDLIEVFGPFWGQLLIDRAAAFPCDPVMLLLPMLGYIASLVGTKVHVKVKKGWKEPMVVWGMVVQPPSSLKSPVGGVFGTPLSHLQGLSAQEHAKAHATFKTKESKWKADCRSIEAQAKKDGKAPELPEPPQPPVPPRHYYVETITIERVASIHAQPNVPGLIAFHDELSDWFASLEKKSGQNDRPRWLKLWTGQAIKHDTATSVNAFAEKTAMSIVGFIQPDKLADLHQNESRQDTGSAGDGLWSRFLPVIPRTIPFEFNDLEVDLTEDLIHLAHQLDQITPSTLLTVPRHVIDNVYDAAWKRWAAMEGETSGARAAFIGKLRGYSVRFAGLLHLLNNDLGDIDPTTAQTAVNLCEFFLAQFDQLAPQISSHEEVDTTTARFLQRVKDKDVQSVRVRDLQRWGLLGRNTPSKKCESFLRDLAEQGIGSFQQVHTKGSPKGAWEWRP